LKVLIIDDDEDLRNLLAHYLNDEWPELEVEQFDPLARDMPDASFPLGEYDVVILDYMLGRGDGLDWLQHLKRRPNCPPVLFLTGAGNEVIAVRAMKTGASDYQRKQELTRERLVASVRELAMVRLEQASTPALAARAEGHEMGARIQIPGINVLRMIGEGGMSRSTSPRAKATTSRWWSRSCATRSPATRRRSSASSRNTTWSSASAAAMSRDFRPRRIRRPCLTW